MNTIKEGKEHLKAKYWLIFAIIGIIMFFVCVGPRAMSTLIQSQDKKTGITKLKVK